VEPPPRGRRGIGTGLLVGLAAFLLLAVGAIALLTSGGGGGSGGSGAAASPTATTTAHAQRTAKPKNKATSEASATTTPAATPTPTATAPSMATGNDAAALQKQAFDLNNAGRSQEALPVAAKAVELCKGSTQVSPCAYALYEYARALRLTGNPQQAIAVLQERKQRFPNDQPQAVAKEIALDQQALAGKSGKPDKRGPGNGRGRHGGQGNGRD
jgi:tetratricopeptide (TPR) repeat protein